MRATQRNPFRDQGIHNYDSVAISHSRDHAWKHISARHHTIQSVFVRDKEGLDLVVLGQVRMDFRNGKTVEQEFAGHLVVDAATKAAGSPRLELMQVFAVRNTPLSPLLTMIDRMLSNVFETTRTVRQLWLL